MARFESRNVSHAVVPAPRAEIWTIVSSAASLAELTPLVKTIAPEGDEWCWQMKTISILGRQIDRSFTEHMSFVEGRRIGFEHQPPPGKAERAGAKGTYTLDDSPEGGTRLSVDITIHVELPLPAISRRAVERVMASMMARTGDRFADNLYGRLGVPAGGGRLPTGDHR